MSRAEAIATRLREIFTPLDLEVQDDSHRHAGHAGARSGGGHFTVKITAAQFQGKSPLQRHQMIYRALGDMMKHEIHALSIQALAPGER